MTRSMAEKLLMLMDALEQRFHLGFTRYDDSIRGLLHSNNPHAILFVKYQLLSLLSTHHDLVGMRMLRSGQHEMDVSTPINFRYADVDDIIRENHTFARWLSENRPALASTIREWNRIMIDFGIEGLNFQGRKRKSLRKRSSKK